MEKGTALVFAILVTLLVAVNFYFFSELEKPERRIVLVERVIDGDTLVIENSKEIRLLNINTPEKNNPGYEEAKLFLANFEGKEIEIEELSLDRYGRTLARIYTPEYLNLEIVKKGFATKFLVDKNELNLFSKAEEDAINNEAGIWKKSSIFGCIETELNPEEETVLIKNNCETANIRDWIIKDESRKQYKFQSIYLGSITFHTFNGTDNSTDIFWSSKENVWNNDRDTLYLFDSENKLAHFEVYGY